MGYFICLANKDLKISPPHWKLKVIEKVAKDIKTAETLALETAIDDAIHLSNMLMELYSGNPQHGSIPVVVNEDSLSLVESQEKNHARSCVRHPATHKEKYYIRD